MRIEIKKDLILIDALALLLILIITLFPNNFLRIALGLPFLLFFPGYMLIFALFPEKEDLGGIERIALSIGLSIALVPLIGLLLNFTPFGIRLHSVLLSLTGFIFLVSLIAWHRRNKLSSEERFVLYLDIEIPNWKELRLQDRLYYTLLFLLILIAGITLIYAITNPNIEKFTEFYLLDPKGRAENYPNEITLGETGIVTIGIANHEGKEVEYLVMVRLENEIIETIEGIRLQYEERWEEKVSFVPNKVGENMKLEFLLYKDEEEKPYRSLHLFVNVK